MTKRLVYACAVILCLSAASISDADTTVVPSVAVGFEDDYAGCGPTVVTQDDLAEVLSRDQVFAPRLETCVAVDYFATGKSAGYLDALSLKFDVGSLGGAGKLASVLFRVYLKKGAYSDGTWHAIRLYAGAFDTQDEDCDNGLNTCWSLSDEFPGVADWEGWVERNVPVSWLRGDTLEVTLRIWNARIDAVSLSVMQSPPASAGSPLYAAGFENDYQGCGGQPVVQDVTREVSALDGAFAPRLDPCVFADYFATGASQGWLDAMAVRFDLSAYGNPAAIASAVLHIYVRKGTYSDASWHAVRLYPGLFNSQDQDCDYYACWTTADEFPGGEAWEGWIERTVPLEWLSGSTLDMTVRIWNAKVDAITLVVGAPTPTRSTTWGSIKQRYR